MTMNLRRVGSALAFASLLATTGCKDLKIESDKPQYQYGEVASLWLVFKDQRVPDGEGSFSWKSNRDGTLGSGNRITLESLSAGTHTLTVQGKYKGKKAKSKKKKITITNEEPRALVHAPLNNASFPVGSTVEFRGAANDLEDGQISGTALSWSSSIDGTLGYGSTISVSNLSPGAHRITLSAADQAGAKGRSTFKLEITNQAPLATISKPSSDLSIHVMEVLTLRGHAVDPDPVLGTAEIPSDQLSWRSSKDGHLGNGRELSTSKLSGGTHTITLSAKDEFGEAGLARIKVRVINDAPTARITSPGDNQFFPANDTITFHVDARDPETSLDEKKIVWRSNKDGRIGRGFRVRTDDLSANEHRITVEVTDEHGATARDTVTVLITNEAPVAQISQPLNGSRYRYGETIVLRGSATDREDGSLSGSNLEWRARSLTTDRETKLGSGERVEVRARRLVDRLRGFGDVEITLIAEDDNDTQSQPVVARIALVNRAPTVRIASPSQGQQIAAGAISFSGFGQDPDRDEYLSGKNMVWTARSPNGTVRRLGRGEQTTVGDLAPGRYRITLTGIDPDDDTLTATASVRINVQPATATTTTAGGSAPGVGLTAVVNGGN